MTFLTNLEVREILCIFRKVLERKAGKEIPESSRFEFLQKFLANNSIKAYIIIIITTVSKQWLYKNPTKFEAKQARIKLGSKYFLHY